MASRRAESEAYEHEIVAWWREKPASYPDGFGATWAKRTLEEIRILGFCASLDDKGAPFLADVTGEVRPPPAHIVKGFGRTVFGLRVDPASSRRSGRRKANQERSPRAP